MSRLGAYVRCMDRPAIVFLCTLHSDQSTRYASRQRSYPKSEIQTELKARMPQQNERNVHVLAPRSLRRTTGPARIIELEPVGIQLGHGASLTPSHLNEKKRCTKEPNIRLK